MRAALGATLLVDTTVAPPGYGMHVGLGRTPLPAELVITVGALTEIRIGPDPVAFSRERDAEAIESELRFQYGQNVYADGLDQRTAQGRRKVRELTWTFASATVVFRYVLEESAAGVADDLS
jgi:hypothetical protein